MNCTTERENGILKMKGNKSKNYNLLMLNRQQYYRELAIRTNLLKRYLLKTVDSHRNR